MNDEQIKKVLEDIYNIDESLRQHEKKLIKIIKQILESRPDTKFDKDFARKLRVEVMERVAQLEEHSQSKLINLFNNFTLMRKAYYMVGAAVFIALLIIPVMYYYNKGATSDIKLAYQPTITKVADQAFGSIYVESQDAISGGKGAGGGGGMPVSQAEGVGMPAPQIINFNYVYKGDEISFDQEQLPVYKRIKSSSASKSMAQNLAKINLGMLDLNKFSNTELTNFNVTQEQEFGFEINFNLKEGLISINANWNKWPRPDKDCKDQACFEQFRLKIEDVPEDEKLIAIADQFISQYGIDMTNYEQGEVLDYWKINYERALAYIPETIPVVYPLVIDNKTIHDQSGNKDGIRVEVNIRHNKVAGLHSIAAQNYQSSNYEAETDSKEIIAIAENGGMYRRYTSPNSTKTIDIELGTPTLSIVKIWQYDQDKGEGTDLYVPSLIFPVTSVSEEIYFKQDNVVVPLVKEVLKEREDNMFGVPGLPPVREIEAIEE